MKNMSLWDKYNKPVPRYTSYPAVPNWNPNPPHPDDWFNSINQSIDKNNEISLYIHLPFCEQLCTYCACNKRITKNHKVESPYIDTVIKEWKYYLSKLDKTPIIKEIHLGGGTPTFFSPQMLSKLITSITENIEMAKNPSFAFEAHPNSTTYEHLAVLYNLGFQRLSIGVQDISPMILKAINRDQTKEEVVTVTQQARAIGYTSINYDIIYGLPFQTTQHIKDTVEFVNEMRPDRLAFYAYAHVPWKSKGQRAFSSDDLAHGVEKHKLKEIGETMLRNYGYESIAMDHYALPSDNLYKAYKNGKLFRNFMGFTDTTSRCQIGLGNSSISDSGTIFMQNEKSVEGYQQLVNEYGHALFKGHERSELESTVGSHVLDLICNDRTKFQKTDIDNKILQNSKSRIALLEEDGLVEMNGKTLSITPLGKPFVRNICAALDPYISHDKKENRYSMAI